MPGKKKVDVDPRAVPRPLTWRRLAGRSATLAVAAAVAAAAAETFVALVSGRIAQHPTSGLVTLLAVLALGSAVMDAIGNLLISGAIGRAEGEARIDLVRATLRQPLPVLEEQGVGELLDRVDSDPAQLASLGRQAGWWTFGSLLRLCFAWIVAAWTWWPAAFLLPAIGLTAMAAARGLPARVAERRIAEQGAWSQHTAQLEEAVAARDDLRTSLGQAHVVRRYAEQGSEVLRRVAATGAAASALTLRSALVIHAALAVLVLAGVAMVRTGHLDVAGLVTLWILMSGFVGQLATLADQVPQLQTGLGALARMRALLAAPAEPAGGGRPPRGDGSLDLRHLTVGYDTGFAVRDVDLTVPAGTTCALVGRSGAGKSTLVKVLSRAVEPPVGTVFLGGRDVTSLDIEELRRVVGVVTQRTEVLSATLAENIALFTDVPRAAVERALDALGLTSWVAALPQGLDTKLGAGGRTLSAGEEQLIAFTRLLVRDVEVVVLDEATARMDPYTERLVTGAMERLLAGRTGIVVAHRLSTTTSCDAIAVMDGGRVVQHGPASRVTTGPGPFRDLVGSSLPGPSAQPAEEDLGQAEADAPAPAPTTSAQAPSGPQAAEAVAAPPDAPVAVPSLARTVIGLILSSARIGILTDLLWFAGSLLGAYGIVSGFLWGRVVAGIGSDTGPWWTAGALSAGLLLTPIAFAFAVGRFPVWWSMATLRLRLSLLTGQTHQRRLARTPAGEVAARSLDSDRLVVYAHRWVDVMFGTMSVILTAVIGRSWLAGAVTGGVLVASALVAGLGAPVASRAAREAVDLRARSGRSLVSALEAVRTVKLSGATDAVRRHLSRDDARRIQATIREQRVRVLLGAVPTMLMWTGVVVAWTLHLTGVWTLATSLLVATAIGAFSWWGTTAASAITDAPAARTWLRSAGALAGSTDLVSLPDGVDLLEGTAPAPALPRRVPLETLELRNFAAVHDDGTVGVVGVNITLQAGEVVLVVGRVGSGKSSLLAALAGLVHSSGELRWNGEPVEDRQLFLRPGQVSYVAQVPRVVSGTFEENVVLDHARELDQPLADARLHADVMAAGGSTTLIGTRGTRLSGGQLQRLALARALASDAELLVADDITSALDVQTERELWAGLRRRGSTILGSTSRRSALAQADRVVVLDGGRMAAVGTWRQLEPVWGHLAD